MREWSERFVLLLFFLTTITTIILLLCSSSLLPPDTSRTPPTKWRGESKVDMFLGIKTDDEGWNIDNLLANTGRSFSQPM